jgi:hypothetical protein
MDHVVLFATESLADPSIPWWWKDVFVPVGVGVLSALLTWFAGFLTVRQTQWYRRLSRWEPYGRELWLLQAKIYGEVCQAASLAMLAAYDKTWNCRNGDPERNTPFCRTYYERRAVLDALAVQSRILLGERFNDVYAQFAHTMFEFSTASNSDPTTHDTCETMRALYGQLLDAARESLGTAALEKKLLTEILENVIEDRAGPPGT